MVVKCDGKILADKVGLANSFFTRLKGLMGKEHLEDGEGLLLMHCSSVHCFFMKTTIDAVYLSKNMTVLGTETLTPWSVGRHIKGAAHVLELATGTASFSCGAVLEIDKGGKPYACIG